MNKQNSRRVPGRPQSAESAPNVGVISEFAERLREIADRVQGSNRPDLDELHWDMVQAARRGQ